MGNSTVETIKAYTLTELSQATGGVLNQLDNSIRIKRISPPKLADEETLALALSEEEIKNLAVSKAQAALVPQGVNIEGLSTIQVERPRLAMMKLMHLFYIPPDAPVGIHPTATVHPDAQLGQNVSIGPNVVIGRGAVIGDNTKLVANVYVGKFTKIGSNCFFHPGVNIGDFIYIGNNVIINHGASIGGDGFSFVTENPNTIETARQEGKIEGDFSKQVTFKIPSLGSVEIHDDVEIGANATVDRGTLENTVIGKGTKVDNLVMIAHNCRIGENCLIISQVGIAGSSVVGDRTVLAGQVGVADHITIGSDVIVTAQSGISKSISDKSIVMGTPAVPRKEFIRQHKYLKDMESLVKEFKALKQEVEALKQQ